MHSLSSALTKGVREILGLVPSNSRGNTSRRLHEALQSGNIVEIRFRFISTSFPLYFRFRPLLPDYWKYSGNALPLRKRITSMEAVIAMTGKPHHSSLIPHEIEILNLRNRRPPMPYAQIAELLRGKYNLAVQAPAIFKFIKVRSRGRKVYSYGRTVHSMKPAEAPKPTATQTRPDWNFKPCMVKKFGRPQVTANEQFVDGWE